MDAAILLGLCGQCLLCAPAFARPKRWVARCCFESLPSRFRVRIQLRSRGRNAHGGGSWGTLLCCEYVGQGVFVSACGE